MLPLWVYAIAQPVSGEVKRDVSLPVGAAIGASGFATILTAPPKPYPNKPPPPLVRRAGPLQAIARRLGISAAEAERRMNPDQASGRAAMALAQRLRTEAEGNFVAVVIERDPLPRYVFYFRSDAVATLRRFTSDPRFRARDQGVPKAELQPIFDEWWKRFQPDRLIGGGSVEANRGVVQFDMNVDEAEFRTIAAREGWTLPERLELRFSPPHNPHSVDPTLVRLVRVFAREDRRPAIVLTAALRGRVVLRDGCFRLENAGQTAMPLVLFGRDSELTLDTNGYMVVRQAGPETERGAYRVGEVATWAGPRGAAAADTGLQALHARCGEGPVVNVGDLEGVFSSRVRAGAIDHLTAVKRISRQAAWDQIKACFAEEDARNAQRTPGTFTRSRECNSPYPDEFPPRPPHEAQRKRTVQED